VGKTELAKALATVLQRELMRLQCYDGLEQREALYEWNYAAQLLHMRAAELPTGRRFADERGARGLPGPLPDPAPVLQALQAPAPGAVLLIDEVDRADEPFEAFLLEYLGEYQVSIPEIGTVRATATPVTILTSNRTRDLNDAVKRRCLYHWLDYPERERELAIVRARVPGPAKPGRAGGPFCRSPAQPAVCHAFQRAPGIAESVEWAKALVALDTLVVDPEVVSDTAGILFKQREDVAALTRTCAPNCWQANEPRREGLRAASPLRPNHAARRCAHRQAGRQPHGFGRACAVPVCRSTARAWPWPRRPRCWWAWSAADVARPGGRDGQPRAGPPGVPRAV
jgi:MoxR-like ATPase